MIDWLGIAHLFGLSRTEAMAGIFTPMVIFAVFFLEYIERSPAESKQRNYAVHPRRILTLTKSLSGSVGSAAGCAAAHPSIRRSRAYSG